jgi:tetratricopeptide (TPR) repeat protein
MTFAEQFATHLRREDNFADAYVVSEPPIRRRIVALASALARAGHTGAAAHLAGKALNERRDRELTAFTARLLLDAGDPNGASEQLEAGARVHGWGSETRYVRAVAAAQLGHFEEAIGFSRELVRDPVRGGDAQLLLVHLLLDTGDVEGARRAAEVALRERPDSTDRLLARAHVARRDGEMNEQLALVERARTLDPDNLAVRTAHGIALLDTGARAEGQRELARVLALEPRDPVAAKALLGSSVRSRRARSGLRAVYLLTPPLSVLVALLVAWLLGKPAPPWLSSLYFGFALLVIIGSRILVRSRTDRSVSAIMRDARRRFIRGRPPYPTLRPVRWLLVAVVASLWISFATAAALLYPVSGSASVAALLFSVPGWAILVASLQLWRRRKAQIAREEPRSFDPASCQCHRVASVSGWRARVYVERHLAFESATDVHGVTQYRCDLLGVRWLCYSEQSHLPGTLPAALRLQGDFVPVAEGGSDDRPIGFYL